MQTQLIAASLVVFIASPALADYYLAQDPTTKQCKIVDAKPDGISMLMVGKSSYDLRSLALMAVAMTIRMSAKDLPPEPLQSFFEISRPAAPLTQSGHAGAPFSKGRYP